MASTAGGGGSGAGPRELERLPDLALPATVVALILHAARRVARRLLVPVGAAIRAEGQADRAAPGCPPLLGEAAIDEARQQGRGVARRGFDRAASVPGEAAAH